jgi:hypothetical protein
MTDYLVFDTEAAAQKALGAIYAAMVGAISSPDLLDVATGQVVPKDELTPEQTIEVDAQQRNFPIFGINAATGTKNATDGFTTAWAVAQETVQGAWVFPMPDESLMVGVTNYTAEPYDPEWFPAGPVHG